MLHNFADFRLNEKSNGSFSRDEVKNLLWEIRKFYHTHKDKPYNQIRDPFKTWIDKHVDGKINEDLEDKLTNDEGMEEFLNLQSHLDNAIDSAANLHAIGTTTPEIFGGTEGNDISEKLEKIWAAFSTGDPEDRSHNDEIFKS